MARVFCTAAVLLTGRLFVCSLFILTDVYSFSVASFSHLKTQSKVLHGESREEKAVNSCVASKSNKCENFGKTCRSFQVTGGRPNHLQVLVTYSTFKNNGRTFPWTSPVLLAPDCAILTM